MASAKVCDFCGKAEKQIYGWLTVSETASTSFNYVSDADYGHRIPGDYCSAQCLMHAVEHTLPSPVKIS